MGHFQMTHDKKGGTTMDRVKMPQKIWDRLSKATKRDIILNVMFVTTEKNEYCLGANDHTDMWILSEKPRDLPDGNWVAVDQWR